MKPTEQDAASFLRWMCRYLVAMQVRYDVHNSDGSIKPVVILFSGFVLRLHGCSFWVTAGHCIKKLERELMDSPGVHIHHIHLMDYFGTDAVHQHMIAFPYERGDAKWFFREKVYDFVLVPLRHLYCMNLATNGVQVVERHMWFERTPRNYIAYKMVGLPANRIRPNEISGNMNVEPFVVPVEPLEPNELEEPPEDGWFIGRLPTDPRLEDIEGMSGGPIYGFWKDENGVTHYAIIALQSSWNKDTRVIYGYPLWMFAEVIHEVLEDLIRFYEAKNGEICDGNNFVRE